MKRHLREPYHTIVCGVVAAAALTLLVTTGWLVGHAAGVRSARDQAWRACATKYESRGLLVRAPCVQREGRKTP